MNLIVLLMVILVICVVLWCVRLLIGAFAVPEPMATVLLVVAIIVCLLILLQSVWGIPGVNLRVR